MLQKLYLYEGYLAPGMHTCIIKRPASGVRCLQTVSKSGGDEPWDSLLLCLSPVAHLFFPVASEGCPLMSEEIVPPHMVGERTEGVMPLEPQLKVKAEKSRYWGL